MDEERLHLVVSRIADGYEKYVSCDKGWWPIIEQLDLRLAEIDPSYVIYQVKEKFGQLRFYYEPSHPKFRASMQPIVDEMTEDAASICEVTGKPGKLMVRDAPFKTFRTLCSDFDGNGWSTVE